MHKNYTIKCILVEVNIKTKEEKEISWMQSRLETTDEALAHCAFVPFGYLQTATNHMLRDMINKKVIRII